MDWKYFVGLNNFSKKVNEKWKEDHCVQPMGQKTQQKCQKLIVNVKSDKM